MPIEFDLEDLRILHGCHNYFETGLWDPTKEVSSRKALKSGFNKVYCIEIRKDWVEMANIVFKDDIDSGKYHIICDDSVNMKKYLTTEDFQNRTMFFLDAHVDSDNIQNYKKKCPLFYELDAIKSLDRKDNIILIDDLRIITKAFPWGETSYGRLDFLNQIKRFILSINNNYRFKTLPGCIEDDVLLAYV